MHLFSFLTELGTNKVFTSSQAMKQGVKLDFVVTMEKEVKDHESHGHWKIVEHPTLPQNAKPIKAIRFFNKRKDQMGHY